MQLIIPLKAKRHLFTKQHSELKSPWRVGFAWSIVRFSFREFHKLDLFADATGKCSYIEFFVIMSHYISYYRKQVILRVILHGRTIKQTAQTKGYKRTTIEWSLERAEEALITGRKREWERDERLSFFILPSSSYSSFGRPNFPSVFVVCLDYQYIETTRPLITSILPDIKKM